MTQVDGRGWEPPTPRELRQDGFTTSLAGQVVDMLRQHGLTGAGAKNIVSDPKLAAELAEKANSAG